MQLDAVGSEPAGDRDEGQHVLCLDAKSTCRGASGSGIRADNPWAPPGLLRRTPRSSDNAGVVIEAWHRVAGMTVSVSAVGRRG